jgi:uncharacterized membrane protein
MKPTLWHRHPAVRTGAELTVGERAADILRGGMGSWIFILSACAFMGLWMSTKGFGGDPAPYILLNLCLSILAGLQGAIILIAQKRADQIASEEAHHTLQNTELLKELVDQNTELTSQIHELVCKGKT